MAFVIHSKQSLRTTFENYLSNTTTLIPSFRTSAVPELACFPTTTNATAYDCDSHKTRIALLLSVPAQDDAKLLQKCPPFPSENTIAGIKITDFEWRILTCTAPIQVQSNTYIHMLHIHSMVQKFSQNDNRIWNFSLQYIWYKTQTFIQSCFCSC